MKQLLWVGNSYKVLVVFPDIVKQAAGFQLHLIQQGRDPDDWKPMQSIGAGVREIRVHADGSTGLFTSPGSRKASMCSTPSRRKGRRPQKKDLDIARVRLREVIKQRTRS